MDDLLKYAVLLAISEEMKKYRAEPKGLMYPISVEVSELTILDFVKDEPHTPLFSLTLYNDGHNNVYVGINAYQKITPLKPGEYLTIEFEAPVIRQLYLDVELGKNTYIRGFGIY